MYELLIPHIAIVITLGLIAGSFINMASYRLALENNNIKELIFKRSYCPKCNNKLKIRNLIPLFSWLIQNGKCFFCQEAIAIRYILIEIFSSITFLIIYLIIGKFNIELIILYLMTTLLIIMTVTDLENYFIPDITQIIFVIITIFYHIIKNDNIIYYLISSILFYFFWLIVKLYIFVFKK